MEKRRRIGGKVLIFAKAFPPNLGGVETYSEEIARAYRNLGLRPTVITQFHGPPGRSELDGIPVINVGLGPQLLVFLRMLFAAWRTTRTETFHFTHATTWRVAVPALFLRRSGPVLVTVHGREVAQVRRSLAWLMHWVFRHAHRVAVISQCSLDVCCRYEPQLSSKSVVSWNGLSYAAEALRPRKPDVSTERVTLFTACQLTVRKNVQGTLKAMSLLRGRGYDGLKLIIAGDGPERERLEKLAEDLGVARQVRFLGYVPRAELPNWYRQATVFIHPQTHAHDTSDFESFCLVIVDAMSLGVAVIAGRDGAPSEYIRDRETGILVEGKNPEEIADAIEFLILNPIQREAIACSGRDWALSHLGWEAHVERLLRGTGISET